MSRPIESLYNLQELEKKEVESDFKVVVWQAFLDRLDGILAKLGSIEKCLHHLAERGK